MANYGFDPDRPLVISDADEVLVHFARPFGDYLAEQGYDLHLKSYHLHGNIIERSTGAEMPVDAISEVLDSFFATRVANCPPVEGAAAALRSLSREAQVIILSNVPEAARQAREDSLRELGFDYPLFSNRGPKGSKVREMVANRAAPTVFIDDLPHNHDSVALEAPAVHRIHFVADQRLRPLIDCPSSAHHRVDEWGPAHDYIARFLKHGGTSTE